VITDVLADRADRAAAAHQASWCQTHARWGRGWLETHTGFVVSFSELPVAAFNGATVYGDHDADELREALTKVGFSGYPYSLQCRPGALEPVSAMAGEFELAPQIGAPLMVSTRAPSGPPATGLKIRQLAPEENHLHASILADAFGAPLDVSIELMPERLLEPANVWTLVGDCEGASVTTAYMDLHGSVGNIHNVGTRKAFRGRGFGATITAAAARLAFSRGADLAMLLSSEMAIGVYQRVGFAEIEHWSAWESTVMEADGGWA
jgi:GNAT superfamily N-acetyltransferase